MLATQQLYRKGGSQLLLKAAANTYTRFMTTTPTTPLLGEHITGGAGAGLGNVRDRMIPSARAARGSLYKHSAEPHTCTIIGAPMTYGQPFVGTDSGPSLLREAGLRGMLSSLGWRVEDLPNLDFDESTLKQASMNSSTPPDLTATFKGNAKNNLLVGAGSQILADLVETKLNEGRFPLILGGDHSIGIGSLAGVLRARPNTGVIWVDAHADLNIPTISESGNMHGMPVGLLMEGVSPAETIPGFEWLKDGPRLQPDSIVYVGLRDVDPEERALIQSLGIAAYTMHEIDRYGIGQVMEMALGHLLAKDPNRPLHLSYDIDAVDPVLAPATGTKVRGGLNFREAHYVAEAVACSGNLASADIVELNPTLSHEEGAAETVDLGLQIITSFMGKSII
jgi:arginase